MDEGADEAVERKARGMIAIKPMPTELKAPICNYIRLVAAIFSTDSQKIASKYGVTLPEKARRLCPVCGEPITTRYAHSCEKCRFIPIACAACGKITYAPRARLFYKNENRRSKFCSQRCKGIWIWHRV